MKTNYLFPHRFKKIGWIIFFPSVLLGIYSLFVELQPEFLNVSVPALLDSPFLEHVQFFRMIKDNILDEILGVLIIVGGVFIVFSKEKVEDEFISKIRLESLVRATYLNYAILLFALLFIYNMGFFTVMIINMFTILIFFIIHFHWSLYKSKKSLNEEIK
jgi:amino acid transporter